MQETEQHDQMSREHCNALCEEVLDINRAEDATFIATPYSDLTVWWEQMAYTHGDNLLDCENHPATLTDLFTVV